MYYILLHKWDKGQLQIPTINPSTLQRFSTSCLPLPQINIKGVESLPGSSAIVPPWQTLNAPVVPNPNGSAESVMDDNLARYLNLGRRHTLGAAHNVMLVPQEEMNRLRKINESSSSKASSGFGSIGINPQIHPEVPFKLLPTTRVDEKQSSIGSINSPDRQHLQTLLNRPSRRRASDGGHYAAAYRMFLERKNPLYAQMSGISPNTLQESTSNSVRHMLQYKIETDKRYGRLPSAQQWIHYKKQLSVTNSTGLNSSAFPPIVQLSNMVEPCIDLRKQVQPFQISPHEIQEQLQQLHLKSQSESSSNDTSGISSNESTSSSSSLKSLLQKNDSHVRPVSPGMQERQRRQGITLNVQQHAQLATLIGNSDHMPAGVGNSGTTSLQNGMFTIDQSALLVNGVHHVPISYTQDSLQTTQHIPIYLNQHMSLLHPKVANQIAQQQVGELVTHISLILKRFGIVYECNSNIFTISHQGVEFQIHVQVSPHFTLQNALQLNLQYMHVSGDPQLYQNLCTQLAPHFIPTVQ